LRVREEDTFKDEIRQSNDFLSKLSYEKYELSTYLILCRAVAIYKEKGLERKTQFVEKNNQNLAISATVFQNQQ